MMFILIVAHANTSEDTLRIHMLNSIIASVIVVNVLPGFSSYSFLKAI